MEEDQDNSTLFSLLNVPPDGGVELDVSEEGGLPLVRFRAVRMINGRHLHSPFCDWTSMEDLPLVVDWGSLWTRGDPVSN